MRSATSNTSLSLWLTKRTAIPLGLQVADHGEQAVDVPLGQRGGGLVENEELQLAGERPADGHELLQPDRQLADLLVEGDGSTLIRSIAARAIRSTSRQSMSDRPSA